jgi:hypothetical protein
MTIALLLSGTAIAQTSNDTTSTAPTGTSPTNSQSSSMGTSADATPPTDTSDADMNNDVNTGGDTGATASTETSTMPTTNTGTMSTDAGPVTSGTGTMSSSTGTMSAGVQTGMAPASGQVIQPGNSEMERDARGVAVKSDSAVVPAGWNGVGGSGMGGPMVDPSTGQSAAETEYPACSATVTDNCVQTYERGRAR